MERRGEIVFEWEGKWYSVSKKFRASGKKHVILPNGSLLKHNGYYQTLVLLSYADYAMGFTSISYKETDKGIEDIAEKYNAVIAQPIEEQILAGF